MDLQLLPGGGWTDYIYAGTKRVAKAPGDAVTGNTEFYHSDLLGSARLMTNAQGTMVPGSEGTFLPFGEEYENTKTTNHYKFTGKERDAETENDYFGARFYAFNKGRFLTTDPSTISVVLRDPQSWNRYSYTLNNPVINVDRNGKWTTRVHEEIIDTVFSFLDGAYRRHLKEASAAVDIDQTREGAYKHGMSPSWSTPEEKLSAEIEGDNFIDSNLDEAVEFQLRWEANGFAEYSSTAIYIFGRALHTATDRTSPQHQGNQEWDGLDRVGITLQFGRAFSHGVKEAYAGYRDQVARAAADNAARRLWADFLKKLAEARQRAAQGNSTNQQAGKKKKKKK